MEEGTRIELVAMLNDPHPIPVGTRGTITWNGGVVRLGNVAPYTQYSVQWDNGRTLGICVPPDVVRVINDAA